MLDLEASAMVLIEVPSNPSRENTHLAERKIHSLVDSCARGFFLGGIKGISSYRPSLNDRLTFLSQRLINWTVPFFHAGQKMGPVARRCGGLQAINSTFLFYNSGLGRDVFATVPEHNESCNPFSDRFWSSPSRRSPREKARNRTRSSKRRSDLV
jgi:hypothetical protein